MSIPAFNSREGFLLPELSPKTEPLGLLGIKFCMGVIQDFITHNVPTLPETNKSPWKIHNFDGIYQERRDFHGLC